MRYIHILFLFLQAKPVRQHPPVTWAPPLPPALCGSVFQIRHWPTIRTSTTTWTLLIPAVTLCQMSPIWILLTGLAFLTTTWRTPSPMSWWPRPSPALENPQRSPMRSSQVPRVQGTTSLWISSAIRTTRRRSEKRSPNLQGRLRGIAAYAPRPWHALPLCLRTASSSYLEQGPTSIRPWRAHQREGKGHCQGQGHGCRQRQPVQVSRQHSLCCNDWSGGHGSCPKPGLPGTSGQSSTSESTSRWSQIHWLWPWHGSYPYVYVDTARHLLFATPHQLTLLGNAKTWYVDGTFSIVRKPFEQLFGIHAFVKGDESNVKQVPLAFVLMTCRTKNDYKKILKALRKVLPDLINIKKMVMDFEIGLWSAVRSLFPAVELQGCAFHWTQAIWHKVQDLGLAVPYMKHRPTQDFIRQVTALTFLPADHIPRMSMSIRHRSASKVS